MGLQHFTKDMSKIPLKYNINVLFYTKYTHPTLICRGTDARTHGRTHGRTENIYSVFRDKLLLLGEHVYLHSTIIANPPSLGGGGSVILLFAVQFLGSFLEGCLPANPLFFTCM